MDRIKGVYPYFDRLAGPFKGQVAFYFLALGCFTPVDAHLDALLLLPESGVQLAALLG
jgi:hypothetical protein